ncbi:hypothetical protein [Hymenobacter sp. IS2118]|uniref:hypothetical protein n=1 Tax=Hymenobacter sp. IS2118 TaxID=1505605 RepID=UPI000551914B|nr:hypothetical protein [Hymenobacter sp. IS2118]
MRYLLISAFLLLLLAAGCKKSAPAPTLDGTYTGTFQREPGGPVAQVSLVFSAGEWSGTSQITKYPALCSGTYTVTSNEQITFTNGCPWTTDFDGTLILSGEYEFSAKNNLVIISKQRNGERDIYRLTKQ